MRISFLKKAFILILCLVMLCPACSCSSTQVTGDSDTLTMYIGLGLTNLGYYAKLHDLILQQTGIDVKFVYTNTMDTTSDVTDMLQHGDIPADIITTAAMVDSDIQENAFLNLANLTNLTELFSISTIQNVSINGSVYQLPMISRLIGIQYNKTLFDEQGWSLPNTMEDMVALKAKAEAAGYLFAVSGGVATGHGFNYLLNVMGSEYLASTDGSSWLDNFISGNASIDEFAQKINYFEDYTQAGLFGHMHTEDWNAKNEFSQQRALFYYNTIGDAISYDGYRYNSDGTLYGATYGEDGLPVAKENETGEAVFIDGAYVYYDETNEAHQGLTRYTIPGTTVLHDSYGTMPWVSRDGSLNSYIKYDNVYLALDKKLGETGQEEKLSQAIKVLTFMASEEATELMGSILPDGFIGTKSFQMDESRMYAAFETRITQGFLMPWWYGYFDTSTIVNVGEKVNQYIQGIQDITLEDILNELEIQNAKNIARIVSYIGSASETFDYKETSQLQAIAYGISLQQTLDSSDVSEEISVAMIPYMEHLGDISTEKSIAVVQAKIYAGNIPESTLSMYVHSNCSKPIAVRLKGSEILELQENGFHTLSDYGVDYVFPYTVLVKDDSKIDSESEYIVAIAQKNVEQSLYQSWLSDGKVLLDSSGNAYTGNTVEGLRSYLEKYPTISPDTLVWD